MSKRPLSRTEALARLDRLRSGPFAEVARELRFLVDGGALVEIGDPVDGQSLVGVYEVRLKIMRRAGVVYPGFVALTELLRSRSEKSWLTISIASARIGLILESEDGEEIGCFSVV